VGHPLQYPLSLISNWIGPRYLAHFANFELGYNHVMGTTILHIEYLQNFENPTLISPFEWLPPPLKPSDFPCSTSSKWSPTITLELPCLGTSLNFLQSSHKFRLRFPELWLFSFEGRFFPADICLQRLVNHRIIGVGIGGIRRYTTIHSPRVTIGLFRPKPSTPRQNTFSMLFLFRAFCGAPFQLMEDSAASIVEIWKLFVFQ
jgi:hypothetical protein